MKPRFSIENAIYRGKESLRRPRKPVFPLCRYQCISTLLSSRWLFFAFLFLFGGSVLALPIGHHSSSRAGRFLSHFTFERYGTVCGGGNPIISFASPAADGYYFNPSPHAHPQLPTSWSVLYLTSSESGFWAITETIRTASVQVQPVEDYRFTPEEPTRIRAAFLDMCASSHPAVATIATHIRTTDGQVKTPIAAGYVHNAVSLVSFLSIAIRTAVQRPWQWLACRLRPGMCPHCGYRLTATPAHAPCPECGTGHALAAAHANTSK